jgi:hypothetical protein
METDRGESTNIANNHPQIVKRLTQKLIAWHQSMPPDNGNGIIPTQHVFAWSA